MSRVLGAGRMRSPEGRGEGHPGGLSARRGRPPWAHIKGRGSPRAFPQLRPFPAAPPPAPPGGPGSGRSRSPGARLGAVPARSRPAPVEPEFWGVLRGKELRGAWRVAEGPPHFSLLGHPGPRVRTYLGYPGGTPVPWAPRAPSGIAPISSHLHCCDLRGGGQTGEVAGEWLLLGMRHPPSGFLIYKGRPGWGAAPQLPGLYAVSPPGSHPRAARAHGWGHPRGWGLSRGDVRPETGPGLSPKSVFPRRVLAYWGPRAHSRRGHSAHGCPKTA